LLSDPVDEGREDRVTEAAPMVRRQDRHIHDMEVPAAVAEDTAHADGIAGAGVDSVACGPAARQPRRGLIMSLR